MEALITRDRTSAGPHPHHVVGPAGPDRVHAIPVPTTPLLTDALAHVDWSDAYAITRPHGTSRDPQAWADALFHGRSRWVRALFGVRELVVRLVGIEPGGSQVFATVARRPGEVLVGTDQDHLGFRASVLVDPERVVLSTLVQLRNRRGRIYSAVVRRIHPWVVRGMLARATHTIAREAS